MVGPSISLRRIPGAGEDLDGEAGERIGVLAGGGHQLCGRGVVEEARQRFIRDREVAVEHQLAGRPIGGVPLAETVEEASPSRATDAKSAYAPASVSANPSRRTRRTRRASDPPGLRRPRSGPAGA